MTSFVAAMNSPDLTKAGVTVGSMPLSDLTSTKLGVKGSDVYAEAGVGDLRVSFFTQLVRGLRPSEIERQVDAFFANGSPDFLRDLVVLAFQTRDVRGGKGEKDLFLGMLEGVLKHRPTWAEALLSLVPEYGCWKDLWKLATRSPRLQSAIDAVVKRQFELDQETLRPSLLVKWLPREGSQYDALAKHFAELLFPLTPPQGRLRVYRRTLAYLNKRVDTTEIKMCAKVWKTIDPEHVPGRLMAKCKSAFFNQKKQGRQTVQRSQEEDRIECALNFKKHLEDCLSGKVVAKGAGVLQPHEIVKSLLGHYDLSEEDKGVAQAQWESIRKDAEARGGFKGNPVVMCDFSGSMDGTPKLVSLALGILISELAPEPFRDHILTFDSVPDWHSFKGKGSLWEKLQGINALGQGLSTDFQKACDLVLRKLVENKVAPADAPSDLIVLTDMGFDAASADGAFTHVKKNQAWQTHFQMIQDSFAAAGYTAPRIVCWNLRAEYSDFHAKAADNGVVQLSGWSPAVLKALTSAEGVRVQTPYEGLRAALDDTRYDKVREAFTSLA